MPVLAKFCGIVIRMLCERTLGVRLHAFYGNCELVIGLHPLRVIQGEAPDWVRESVMDWARLHQHEVAPAWSRPARAAYGGTPVDRRVFAPQW